MGRKLNLRESFSRLYGFVACAIQQKGNPVGQAESSSL
ncbi:hypothetical protein AVDCRST_MAG81-579 [uncultured Synechococcales cyanobacterium]|uniref:Uncharacterized protein n=1 Tax=uncultured Synechococcales cyanobacterium TaxID=1936017 RepID=A0A6J4UTB1_9CYAN|nr:hypothetical protein AVDCRST_MAG81-579 [uncultured Synechococcales cyanobacterium]